MPLKPPAKYGIIMVNYTMICGRFFCRFGYEMRKSMKAIVNGRIVLKDRIAENGAVLYSDVIEGIVPCDKIPDGCEIIDASCGYITPGFIDLHIHGYLGKDVCDGEEESIRTISKGIIANGVTSYLPTTMTVDMAVIKKSLEVLRGLKEESKSWEGSEILGAHAEGPFISESKKGAQDPRYILPPDAEFVKEYADIIRIISLAPEEDSGSFESLREIRQKTDVVMSLGHTSADYETAIQSIANGVNHATHLFNAMTPLAHRAPGVVGAALYSDISCELIVDTFHVSPALYDMVYKMKGRKLCFITDCLPAGGLPYGEYTLGGNKIIYKDIVCRLEDGTVAGSVLKLNKGIFNVYTNSSIPLWECVNCASLNPAAVIGVSDRKGSIEVGKDADLVILDNEFNVMKTIKKGDTKYEAKG